MTRLSIHFPEQVIPAHTIYKCSECEKFDEKETPHGDCKLSKILPYYQTRTEPYDDIPAWCPLLVELGESK